VVCGKEVSGELVVSGRKAPAILDAAEIVLDLVPASVDALGTIGFFGGVAAAGDNRHGAFVGDLATNFVAVIGLVGGDGQRRPGGVQNVFDDLTVMDLPARQREVQRAALAVDGRVDLRRPAATADADRLVLLPPFAPLAARWAFTIVLSIRKRLSRDVDARVSKTRFQMPRRDQRLNRL